MGASTENDRRLQTRAELREAFKSAIQGEIRFGIREDCRPELDQRWERVMDLLEKMGKKRG